MNVPCEACLASSCELEDCACAQDPNMVPRDDGGSDVGPGCGVFFACFYADFTHNLLADPDPDAGAAVAAQQAVVNCQDSDTTPFTSSSITLGINFIQCLAVNCGVQCVP